jgi:DNA helicase IV
LHSVVDGDSSAGPIHPEFESEQAYVTRAYGLLDRGLADAESSFQDMLPASRATAQAMRRALDILRNSRGSGQLVFGRVDQDGDRMYIGRRRVYDENKDLVVVGWHAPAASVYYQASPQHPHGLQLKRVFVEQDRRLQAIVDEIVAAGASDAVVGGVAPARISDALLRELERSRDGAMREVVATIQEEQFRIIRADQQCILIVQGGPGTGKTVVGLHRAAWLALNDEALRRRRLLVVGPSVAFLSYISGVLPSLDVSDIHQTDLRSMYPGEARVIGVDDPQAARVKGAASMAAVLARALRDRIGWSGADLELTLGGDRFRLTATEIGDLLDDVRGRTLPHSEAREVLRLALSALAFRRYTEHQRDLGRPVIASESTIRRLSAFTNALDRMWPTFTPEELLRSLYGTQSWLATATDGVMSADDRARLYRPPLDSISDEPWTADDLYCLDELADLLNRDLLTYGHVVVDEAQDLSPMQARALARRCPSGSFTVLGDLAQATGASSPASWAELGQHLGSTPVRVETLSVGYRVPAQVLDLAARQLPLIGPGFTAPRSVRHGRDEPRSIHAVGATVLQQALAVAQEAVEASMTTALVVPDGRYDDLRSACDAAGVEAGDGRDGDFASPLTLLPASVSKGLEFDAVVLVEPAEIVASSPVGRRELYIAMTRCTKQLHLVYSVALPAGMEHLAPHPDDAIDDVADGRVDVHPAAADDLDRLVAALSPADRELIAALARRLLDSADPLSRSSEGLS